MPKKKKKRVDFEDDGRTVVNMNVEGMPWYHERRAPLPPPGNDNSEHGGETAALPVKLTGKERLAFAWGVIKAVLLVSGIFILGYLAFILFCLHVWFK